MWVCFCVADLLKYCFRDTGFSKKLTNIDDDSMNERLHDIAHRSQMQVLHPSYHSICKDEKSLYRGKSGLFTQI